MTVTTTKRPGMLPGRFRVPPPRKLATMNATPPRVVGLDPSLTAAATVHADGTMDLNGITGLATAARGMEYRLNGLEKLASEIIMSATNTRPPDIGPAPVLAVMELLPPAGTRSDSERGWLWWEIARRLRAHGVPLLPVSVATIKKYATGKGNAPKSAMIEATVRRMPALETGGDDNLCDAAWAMAIGCALLGHPIVEVPAVNRAALAKLVLPSGNYLPRRD